MVQTKILLDDHQIPQKWYNVMADMPNPPEPVFHPQTLKPVGPEDLGILFCLSGHGHFDMAAYDAYMSGKLEDYEYPEENIKASLANLPKVG